MKNILYIILLSTIIYANDLFTKEEKQWIQNNQTIKVAMLNNFQPFSYTDHKIHQGFTVDLLEKISDISGLQFHIETTKWSAAINNFKNKKVDMITGISYKQSREDFTLFTTPYYEIPTFIFGSKNNTNYKNNDSLIGKKVGVSKKIFYLDSLKKQGIQAIEYTGNKAKAKALALGEIDYFLASYTSGIKAITSQSLSTIKPIDELTSIKKEDLRFGINKDKPILHSIIEKSLISIESSVFTQLSNKWILQSTQIPSTPLKFTFEEKYFINNTPKIKIGSVNSSVPFSFLQDGKKIGFTQDLLDIISQKSGLQFEKVNGTWPEVFGKFKNKEVDIISEISFTKPRVAFTSYTKPYYEIPIGVFTRDDFGEYSGIESLKDKKIGIVKNSYLINILENSGLDIVEIDSSDERFYALNDKRVDAVLSNALSMYRVERLLLKGIKLAGLFEHPKVKSEDLRFGIIKDKPILASIMNKTLDSIPYSKITELKQKWIFEDRSNNVQKKEKQDFQNISFTNEEKEFLKSNPYLTYSEVNWKPLSIISNNKMNGIMGDYLDLVSSRTGIEFRFVPSNSWPHVLEQFQNKKIDIVPGIGTSPQETKLGLTSDTYAHYPMVIVTGDKYKFLDNLSSLNGKTIAVPKYYTSYNFLVKNYPKIKLITTSNIPDALLLVESGKADAFVGHIATSLFYLSELHLENLKVSGTTDFQFEHKYLIQNDNPILLSIINKTFNTITDLERKKIYDKWIQTTITEETIDQTTILQILIGVFIIILYFVYKQHMLKKSVEETSELIDATMEAIFLSKHGKCIDVNQSAVDLFGYSSKKEMIGKNLLEFVAEESKELIKGKFQLQDTKTYEAILRKKDGVKFHTLIRGYIFRSKNIRISSVIDISQLKQLESQAKLASMGEMIGNIAHQWRQPLSIISTAATGLQMQKEYGLLDDKMFHSMCTSINENAQYLSQTIDDFRNFIKGDSEPVEFDLKSDTESFIKLVDTSIRNHSIELILDLDDTIHLKGYPNELLQCFINIFNNAKDAFNQNNIDKHYRFLFIEHKTVNDKVKISFKDNAGGIPENIISKIFEPYFTTKHASQGTGLGLHMSYNLIVNHMKGSIEVFNDQYEYNGNTYTGAEFVITLPLN